MVDPVKAVMSAVDKVAEAAAKAAQAAFEAATRRPPAAQPPVLQQPVAQQTTPVQLAQTAPLPAAGASAGPNVRLADFAVSNPPLARFEPIAAQQPTLPQSPADPQAPSQTADPQLDTVVNGMAQGKSLDLASKDAGFRDGNEGYQAFSANPEYEAGQSNPSSDVRVTTIKDTTGRTVTENYDYQHDQYTTTVSQPGGSTITNPVRDGSGWRVTSDLDTTTGALTTRRENDLGGGEIQERTRLENGVSVQVDTDAGGVSRTEVASPNGTRTSIDGTLDPTAVDAEGVLEDVTTDGTGLTNKEIAGFQVAGYDVTTTAATSDSGASTTTIGDPASGQTLLTATSDHKTGDQSVAFVNERGSDVTRTQEADGTIVEREVNAHDTEYVRTKDGDHASLTINGESVDPARTLDNGTAGITMPDGGNGVILPTGQTVALGANQDGGGGYGDYIEQGLEDGKSLDLLSNRLGWTRDQTVAELYLNGADDVSVKDGTPQDFGLDGAGLPADAPISQTSVTRDGVTLNSVTTPLNGGEPFDHEVKDGENLWDVAERNGLTVDQLLANENNARLAGDDPNSIEPGDRLTIEGGTRTGVSYSFPRDDIGVSGPTLAPVSDGGETSVTTRPGDTAASIAADYPWMTANDVLAANPQLKDGRIRGGETLVIPDSTRLASMNGQYDARTGLSGSDLRVLTTEGGGNYDAQSADGELVNPRAVTLVGGMTDEMLYATRRSAVPGEALEGLANEMKARRPGDQAWASAVDLAAQNADMTFAAQGRTQAVMEPLYDLARGGDPAAFKEHVKKVFGAAAAAEPTPEAVQRAQDSLLAYGPQDAGAQQWVRDATQDFLVNDPKARAAEIQAAYDGGGSGNDAERAAAGAERLAELTDPKTTDPLSAALVLEQAQPTVDQIVQDLGPYDLARISSLNASDAKIVKDEGAAAAGAYADLSAAADSAARSPEGQAAVERLGGQLKDRDLVSNTGYSPLTSGGVSLPLEIAKQRRAAGDAEGAAEVEAGVLQAIDAAERRTIELGDELGQEAAPMVLPEQDWAPFLEDGAAPENWFTDREAIENINALSGQIDDSARWLELAYQGVERYAPDLKGSPSEAGLLAKTDPNQMDPKLRGLFNSSPAAALENYRATNQTGLAAGALDNPTIIPEWSWPARVVRNASINFVDAKGFARPTGAGLALFGLGTYAIGASNKTQEGGSSYVTAGLYIAGGVTEAWSALGQLSRNQFGWRTADGPWWQRAIATGGSASPIFKTALNAPLRGLGWWNAYNAIASLGQGELWPAALHGAAAGGIFAATGPFRGGENLLNSRLTLAEKLGPVKWVKFGGNVVTLLASSGLAVYDMYEKRKPIENLSEKHTEYLTAAGVRPDVADALGIMPGDDAVSVAPRLQALAEYRGTSPQQVLDYLNRQDSRQVFEMAYAAGYVEPSGDGRMPVGERNPAWDTKPRIKADFRPANIAELNQFIELYMSDFPGSTP